MKYLPIIFILFLSCQQQNKKVEDSLTDTTTSSTEKTANDLFSDSVYAAKAPVKILHADPEIKADKRSIKLTYENISDKNIIGVKFKWHGLNAFNEPAQMGGPFAGLGLGATDDYLGIKELNVSVFDISSNDFNKVAKAWVYEVAFQDGTKWTAK